mgnify:CR=1 FL=1
MSKFEEKDISNNNNRNLKKDFTNFFENDFINVTYVNKTTKQKDDLFNFDDDDNKTNINNNNNENDNSQKEEKIDLSIFATSRGGNAFKDFK